MQMGLINRDWRRTKHALVWAWNRRPPLLPDREGLADILQRAAKELRTAEPFRLKLFRPEALHLADSILSLLGGVHAE
jgi:hypothetical protein